MSYKGWYAIKTNQPTNQPNQIVIQGHFIVMSYTGRNVSVWYFKKYLVLSAFPLIGAAATEK